MSLPSAPPAESLSPRQPAGPDTRLRGRWLPLARIGWVVVTVILIVLNLIALPDTYGKFFTGFTPQDLRDLHQIGLTPTAFGIIATLENAPIPLVNLALGLLLFWRRSNDRMALFCAFALVTSTNALQFYNFTSGDVMPILASNAVLHGIALVLFAVGETSLVIFFYLFPSGRFAPRWTRWAALVVALYWLAVIFFPVLPSNAGGPATFFIPLSLVTAVVAQIYRYRRVSTPGERQQTKWVLFGFALAIVFFLANVPVGLLVPPSLKNSEALSNLSPLFPLGFLMIPIFITIAILRSRLWDIDTIINKALVYGALTALLGALYAGLIIGLTSLAGLLTRQTSDPVVLVVSTLAIAALVQPVRNRIQSFIDRRFYRKKYDTTKTLAAFSATLRQEVDLNQLSAHLLNVVQETMQPASASLWLRSPERRAEEPPQRPEPHQ